MGLNQIHLQNYDTVLAVTQDAITNSLANIIDSNVALYYNFDFSQKNQWGGPVLVVAPDPATAQCSLVGTLAFNTYANGNPVYVVQLNSGQGAQTVVYNVTFESATFKVMGTTLTQGAQPWIISFFVELKQAAVPVPNIPEKSRAAVAAAVQGLAPDTFSIQQLYLDLNTARFDQFQNVAGVAPVQAFFSNMMQTYLASVQASGGNIFGYSVVANAQNAPTFMPTALDFCVSLYTDANGQHSKPGLDTLNYLMMTGGRPLPSQAPTGFNFNFVDAPANSNDSAPQGAMAIRSGLYIDLVLGKLSPLLTTLSLIPAMNSDGSNMHFNPSSAQYTFSALNPAQNGLVGNYNYTAPIAQASVSSSTSFSGYDLNFSAACSVAFAGDRINLSGSAVVSAGGSTEVFAANYCSSWAMPQTTYTWSVPLQLAFDSQSDSRLNISIVNKPNTSDPDFQTTGPTVAPNHQSDWQKFESWVNDAVTGTFSININDPGNLLQDVQTELGKIVPELKVVVPPAYFVFPGGTVFVFKNPTASQSGDLAANITYVS